MKITSLQGCREKTRHCFGCACVYAFALLVAVPIFGCGSHGDRLPLSGEVTLNSTPLETGSIRFTSIGTEKIAATGAMIQGGEFDISADKGLPPGTYHVEINSPDEKAPPVMSRDQTGGPGVRVQPDRIPPEYNINSNKKVDVKADDENHFKFEIVSRSAK